MFTIAVNLGAVFIDFFDILFAAVLVDGVSWLLREISAPEVLVTLASSGRRWRRNTGRYLYSGNRFSLPLPLCIGRLWLYVTRRLCYRSSDERNWPARERLRTFDCWLRLQCACGNGCPEPGERQRSANDDSYGPLYELRRKTNCLCVIRCRIFSAEWAEHSLRSVLAGYRLSGIYRLDISQTAIYR